MKEIEQVEWKTAACGKTKGGLEAEVRKNRVTVKKGKMTAPSPFRTVDSLVSLRLRRCANLYCCGTI